MLQTTIAHDFTLEGIGLHSGKMVSVECKPAQPDTGLMFHIQTPSGLKDVMASPTSVMATELATTIGTDGASVSTVEHLLATLRGMGVDNCHIYTESEIPILDGSAAQFADKIDQVGLAKLEEPRHVLKITKPFELKDGKKKISAYPVNTPGAFRITYVIDFPHPLIGVQQLSMDVTPQKFFKIANARTFGFLRDVEAMRTRGLARGGSMENAIVLDDTKVLNPEGLRCKDEFVRHKILDFIGDMATMRYPFQGNFTVACSGHKFNNEFLRRIMEDGALEEIILSEESDILPSKIDRSKLHSNRRIASVS